MLCDFGLSKEMDRSSAETQIAVGSWPWMSPERLQAGDGDPGRSFEDDVYAFGMTIYEVLSLYSLYA
jgi:serine/threonine protein kinase